MLTSRSHRRDDGCRQHDHLERTTLIPRARKTTDAVVAAAVIAIAHRAVQHDRLSIGQRNGLVVLVADDVGQLDLLQRVARTGADGRERTIQLRAIAPVRQDDLVVVVDRRQDVHEVTDRHRPRLQTRHASSTARDRTEARRCCGEVALRLEGSDRHRQAIQASSSFGCCPEPFCRTR